MAKISATVKINPGLLAKFKSVSKEGFRPVGREIKEIIRYGTGSVNAQFVSQTTISPTGSSKWKAKINPWGTRKSRRASAGQESGRWKAAWLGTGQGSFSRTTTKTVSLGVQRSKFPQINILMAESPTTWFPRKRVGRGWAAQVYHGVTNNVWMSAARMAQGFVHNPRAISMNHGIERRVARFMEQYTAWIIDPSRNRRPTAIR